MQTFGSPARSLGTVGSCPTSPISPIAGTMQQAAERQGLVAGHIARRMQHLLGGPGQLPDAGHFPCTEIPDQVNALIEKFIAGL